MLLFLDDDPSRLTFFADLVPDAQRVTTANETIEALRDAAAQGHRLTHLFLDHDLNGEVYVDSRRDDCGMEVVRWIVAERPQVDAVTVHTHNHNAAPRMVAALVEAGYTCAAAPFGEELFLDRVSAIMMSMMPTEGGHASLARLKTRQGDDADRERR